MTGIKIARYRPVTFCEGVYLLFLRTVEDDGLGCYMFVHEEGGALVEGLGTLCREVPARAAAAQSLLHLGMTRQVIAQ